MAEEKQVDLNQLTVKELQGELVKLGMPEEDTKDFQTKKPLINTIQVLKANQAVRTLTPSVSPKEDKADKRKYLTKAERTREIIEAQPKRNFMFPLQPNEKAGVVKEVEIRGKVEKVQVSGAVHRRQINGAIFLYPKGVEVEVPDQILKDYFEKQSALHGVGEDFRIDRKDPETGRPISEQL